MEVLEEISKHFRALIDSKEGHNEVDNEVEEDEGVHHIDDARFEFMFDTLKRLFSAWIDSPIIKDDMQNSSKLKLHLWSLLENGLMHSDFRVIIVTLRSIGFIGGHSVSGFTILNGYPVKLKYEKCHFVQSEEIVQHSLLDCLQDCLSAFCSVEGTKDSDEESIVASVLQSYMFLLGSPSNQVQLTYILQRHSNFSSQLEFLVLYQSAQIARLGVELLAKLIFYLVNQPKEPFLPFFNHMVDSALVCFDPLNRRHDDVRLRAIDLMLLLLAQDEGRQFIKNHKMMHRVWEFLKDPNRMVRSHTVELIGEFVNSYRSHFFMFCESEQENNLQGFLLFVRKLEELCGSQDIADVVSAFDILSHLIRLKNTDNNNNSNNTNTKDNIEGAFDEWLHRTFQKMCWVLQHIIGATPLQVGGSKTSPMEDQWNIFRPLEKRACMDSVIKNCDAVMPSLLHAIHKTIPSIQSEVIRISECLPLVLQTLVLYHYNENQRLKSHNQRLKKQLFEILKQFEFQEWIYWRIFHYQHSSELCVDPFLVCVHSLRQQTDRNVIESAMQALSRILKQTIDILLKDEEFSSELGNGLATLMKDMSWELRDSCLEFISHITDQPSTSMEVVAQFLISKNLVGPILTCLVDNESYTRQSAIEVLKNLSHSITLWKYLEENHPKFPGIMFLFARDSELPPRRCFVELLQDWLRYSHSFEYLQGTTDVKQIVHSLIMDDDWEVKNKTVEFLTELVVLQDGITEERIKMFLGLEGPVLLTRALQDSDRLVRIKTAENLKRVLKESMHPSLNTFLTQVTQINLDQIIEGSSSTAIYGDEDVPITTEASTIDCY